MPSRIKSNDATRAIAEAQRRLESLADGRSTVKRSEIADPVLKDLAADGAVTTGCSASAQRNVSVAKMRKTLETIGSTLATADRNHDGEIGYSEAQRLSPLAARMLDHIAEGSLEPGAGPAAPRLDDSSLRQAWDEYVPATGRILKPHAEALLRAVRDHGSTSGTEEADLERILDLAGGRLTRGAKEAIEEHLDGLRSVSSGCGSSSSAPAPAPPPAPPPVSSGC